MDGNPGLSFEFRIRRPGHPDSYLSTQQLSPSPVMNH